MAHLIRYPLPRSIPSGRGIALSQIISVDVVSADTPINVPVGVLNLTGFIPTPIEGSIGASLLMAQYQPG